MSFNIFYTNNNKAIRITNVMIKKAQGEARKLKAQYVFRDERAEDLAAELISAFLTKLLKFDREESEVEGFAHEFFRLEAKELSRRQGRKKRGKKSEHLSVDESSQNFDKADAYQHRHHRNKKVDHDPAYAKCVREDIIREINELLEQLPDDHQEIIELLRYYGPVDVAKISGKSLTTVKKYIRHARLHFANLYKYLHEQV